VFRNIIVCVIFLLYTASTGGQNLLGITRNLDLKLGDLNESIFVGAENSTKNMKIAGIYDPVN
jgi:hypothetical protein